MDAQNNGPLMAVGILVVGLGLIGLALKMMGPGGPEIPPPKPAGTNRPVKPAEQPQRGFTAEELAEYRGYNDKPVYLSMKNVVYEVNPGFYGPDGPYHCFSGKDATIPLGRSDISENGCNEDWSVLSPSDLEVATQWDEKFKTKYPVVGWFIPPYQKAE